MLPADAVAACCRRRAADVRALLLGKRRLDDLGGPEVAGLVALA